MAARSNHTEKSLIILKLTLDITLHDKKKTKNNKMRKLFNSTL